MTRRALAAVVGCAWLALSCGRAVPSGPPEIRLGVDACDGCGMAISDARFAAAALYDEDGRPRTLAFDDIGCLARWVTTAQQPHVRRLWVHDRAQGDWIDAEAATYVRPPDLATPMGSGWVAFRVRSDAREVVPESDLRPWDAVVEDARRNESEAK